MQRAHRPQVDGLGQAQQAKGIARRGRARRADSKGVGAHLQMPHVIALRADKVEAQFIAQRPVQRQRGVAALRVEQDGGFVGQRETVLLAHAGRGDARADAVAQVDGGHRVRRHRHPGGDRAAGIGAVIAPGVQHVAAGHRQGHALGVVVLQVLVARRDHHAAGADERPILGAVAVRVAQVHQQGLTCHARQLPCRPLAALGDALRGRLAQRQRRQRRDRHRQHMEAARRAAVGRDAQLVAARQQLLHVGAAVAIQAL